jgi:hypothetical protein
VHEQPLVGEQAERLAQRVAGDAERGADVVLGQALAGREEALGDPRPEDVGQPLDRARPPEQAAVGRQFPIRAHLASHPF